MRQLKTPQRKKALSYATDGLNALIEAQQGVQVK